MENLEKNKDFNELSEKEINDVVGGYVHRVGNKWLVVNNANETLGTYADKKQAQYMAWSWWHTHTREINDNQADYLEKTGGAGTQLGRHLALNTLEKHHK